MTTKRTYSTLVLIAALTGANAVAAGNDQPWHYDEDNDTIAYSFVGHPPAPGAPDSSQQTAANRPWYFDEETDTVLYNSTGRSVEQAKVFASMTE